VLTLYYFYSPTESAFESSDMPGKIRLKGLRHAPQIVGIVPAAAFLCVAPERLDQAVALPLKKLLAVVQYQSYRERLVFIAA
jgi:hypothetical protein